MVFVNGVIGGPECDFLYEQIRNLQRYCKNNQNSSSGLSVPSINIVFQVPGSIYKPDFTGIRKDKFSRKNAKLILQVSVDKKWVETTNKIDACKYLYEKSCEALVYANEVLNKLSIEYDEENDIKFLGVWYDTVKKEE